MLIKVKLRFKYLANLCHSQKKIYYELFGGRINSATDIALKLSRARIRILGQYVKVLNVNVEVTKAIKIFVKITLYTISNVIFGNLAWLTVNVGVAQVVTA